MENYELLIFPSAERELQDIIDYVNELSPDAAKNLYDEIVKKIGTLSQMPLMCPLIKNPLLRAKGYRVLLVNNYLVFFIAREKTVEIR